MLERKAYRYSLHDSLSGRSTREEFDARAFDAAERYVQANRSLDDRLFWPVRLYCALDLWLWHLDAFARSDDPVPLFVEAMDRSTALLRAAKDSNLKSLSFPIESDHTPPQGAAFEAQVSGTFSDIWPNLSDDIYFDQSYNFTVERFRKSGFDAQATFAGKSVLDAGCGSGKFSAALARLGAEKVIGLDLGLKGLEFARRQAAKVPYGSKIDFRHGSLLDIPLESGSLDAVWSNGVIHHTLDYRKCLDEFARVLKPGGTLYLYVNGRFGLFELLADAIRIAIEDIPRALYIHYLLSLGVDTGRLYWILDYAYPPYEWKSRDEVIRLMEAAGFGDVRQLMRGIATDQIEQVSAGIPYAEVKYGEAQLKFLAVRR
jgi:SAM-dependent methyltransferase